MTDQTVLQKISNLAFDIQHTDDLQQAFDKAGEILKLIDKDHQPTFAVGEYYVSENKQIYKLTADQRNTKGVWRRGILIDGYLVVSYVTDEELQQDKPATAEQIATFRRAEHFASKGRKLDEFRVGDRAMDERGKVFTVTHITNGYLFNGTEIIDNVLKAKLIKTTEGENEI